MAQELKRPLGVTVIAALTILSGIYLVATGLAAATIPSFLYDFLDLAEDDMSADPFSMYIVAAITIGILVPLGLALLAVGYSALKGKKWAWKALLIVCAASIVAGIAEVILGESLAPAGIIINSFIIIYLLSDQAKAYFGRTPSSARTQLFESSGGT